MFKGFRFRRGLTVGSFAEQAGVAEEQIEEWERRAAIPTKAELQNMATAFNTSIFELLEPSQSLTAPCGMQPSPPLYEWNAQHRRRWGTLPYLLWGYLRLQLTPDDRPRWYPVSCEQAASISKQLHQPSWATMVVALTLNNRCVMFAPQRVTRASLVDSGTAAGDTSFSPEWDADGHTPELYRALRAWAQKDFAAQAGTSFALAMRVLNLRQSGTTYTRKKIAALVDHTVIYLTDSRVIRFSATSRCLHTAVRSVPLGALTVYLAEHENGEEHLVALDQVRVIDLPATDLESRSNAVVVEPTPAT
ncbi:helix-turn-helix transcriptional regulator [Sandarakinorhabdus oryzae]|uniref:helix-turn-helix transcriptional regulator n=1 Tax=Sandarakinorhabdus oryzae TaxID=2675220 RepID=UPI0012E288DB|nr:helix-turn-helix domain-containing protein [Sandarakinorhabdus oryzae]